MSIPPLVCSTPPPPDQCEEDKDPDDFDISYNLSQDDDDDDSFGYGDFSSYNHYQTNCVAQEKKTKFKAEKEISIDEDEQVNIGDKNQFDSKEAHLSSVTTVDENKPKSEEDTNIEDLCLEINEVSISSSEKEDEPSETENYNVDSENVLEPRQDAPEANETQSNLASSEIAVDTTRIEQCKETSDDGLIDVPSVDLDNQSSEPNSSSNDEICKNDLNNEENNDNVKESNLDNSFGEFDDFQFVNKERKTSEIIENCDNPWETNAVGDDDDDFGNFTANFETIEQQKSSPNVYANTEQEHQASKSVDDDDFGDFDDFKSSAIENDVRELSLESGSDQNLPVLNFQASDSEHQVMESITKVLNSVFEEEISEPVIEFEGRLETMLSETWGHLRETDVRQPYIVNWNNSLGQKTLLRALCIDSRNILFGPKWGYNMPKYAVNLSAAPLQPQKPLMPSNPTQSDPVAEKTTPKPSQGGWTDPFTADGQESCNTESESVVEVTATDLDVFEATITTKPDKIYSSTLNVQPLRQISLPDTHIFTPTDSETPTSKTVHYDSGPPILLPQNSLEGKRVEPSTTQHTNDSAKEDDDYWEFQDFKRGTDKSAPTVSASKPDPLPETKTTLNPTVTYQTQVLQPIKMEPLIPTVNWPDPGEIKETFDDFSDFVSNSAWSDKPREEVIIPATENKSTVDTDVLDKINDKHKTMEEINRPKFISNQDFDDDFDTFQSALPPKHIAPEFNIDSLGKFNNIPSQNSTQIADFQNAFPKNNVKSETISVSNSMRPNEALAVNRGTAFSASSPSSKTSPASSNPMHPNLLQPIPTSSNLSSQSKQKTDQILQPLSLESYSQINWPNPGIDLQDLSRFNPVETLQSLKSDLSVSGSSKGSSPVHNQKNAVSNQVADDDWGEFVSSKPKQQASAAKKATSFVDDDEWTDFVSSPSVKPQNGLNTISFNVHTNSNIQKSSNSKFSKNNQLPLDIPTLNYITPKASGHSSYNDRHFQNL